MHFSVGEHLLLACVLRYLVDFCKFYDGGFAFRNRSSIEFGVMPEMIVKNPSQRGAWSKVRCFT
ncbi:hypothetical protein PCIT_a1651 [Pseudoalteromonas citrea]|uniref:Uncharacterized protein n=1 Tax=Pseudoalteromonas citrea TaxID=43655 RepID=A0AAD4AMK1_9GAMM|nr:hypothetical protein PCIT_a1651 [Pseudoalteromonas citrea]